LRRSPRLTGRLGKLTAGVLCLASVVLGAAAAKADTAHLASELSSASTAPQLHVAGKELVNGSGRRIVLHGVDRSGGEWACINGTGIWDGPMGQASVTAIKSWGVNAVRVPLNEACWNGESYVKAADRGAAYRAAVEAYIRLLNRNGLVAIVDLALTDGTYNGPSSACGAAQAQCEKPMPDAAQAKPFWSSVARAFKGNDAVIFDLFNEPFPQAAVGSEAGGWRCWLRGGSACAGIGYPVAGMQTLVNVVRSAGARNVIMLGGIGFANDLTQWLKYKPSDPDHNLAASWHSYNFNPCATASCWKAQVAPVIAKVPVIVGEMGENDCTDSYINPLMKWLDARSTGYLAWAWNVDFDCGSGPSLITSYTGSPTSFGAGYRAHLKSLR
jgi:endoglucanase